MKYNQFKSIGLQRTGTNWLNQLIFDNFNVGKAGGFWKHLTPLGVVNEQPYTNNVFRANNLIINDSCFYIVTYKDFDTWKQSLQRKPADFYKTHDTKTEYPAQEVYEAWMEWANSQSIKENFYMKNYVDWLKNWKTYFLEIQEIAKWERKTQDWEEPEVVHMTGPAEKFDKTRYIKD